MMEESLKLLALQPQKREQKSKETPVLNDTFKHSRGFIGPDS